MIEIGIALLYCVVVAVGFRITMCAHMNLKNQVTKIGEDLRAQKGYAEILSKRVDEKIYEISDSIGKLRRVGGIDTVLGHDARHRDIDGSIFAIKSELTRIPKAADKKTGDEIDRVLSELNLLRCRIQELENAEEGGE